MKSAGDTCFHIDMVDSTVTCDVASTCSVHAVHYKDVEIVRHLHSTVALATQVLHAHNTNMEVNILETALHHYRKAKTNQCQCIKLATLTGILASRPTMLIICVLHPVFTCVIEHNQPKVLQLEPQACHLPDF